MIGMRSINYGGSRPRGQSLLRYQPVCLWYHYNIPTWVPLVRAGGSIDLKLAVSPLEIRTPKLCKTTPTLFQAWKHMSMKCVWIAVNVWSSCSALMFLPTCGTFARSFWGIDLRESIEWIAWRCNSTWHRNTEFVCAHTRAFSFLKTNFSKKWIAQDATQLKDREMSSTVGGQLRCSTVASFAKAWHTEWQHQLNFVWMFKTW